MSNCNQMNVYIWATVVLGQVNPLVEHTVLYYMSIKTVEFQAGGYQIIDFCPKDSLIHFKILSAFHIKTYRLKTN